MYAVILVPQFPLQALLRNQAQDIPAVVLDDQAPKRGRGKKNQFPVIALNAKSWHSGVRLGMTATQAQARCSLVAVLSRDRSAEATLQEELQRAANDHTPDFEATGPGMCTLDLFGCSTWSSDPQAHAESLRNGISRSLQTRLHIGLADTPDLALLAAQMTETGVTWLRGDLSEVRDASVLHLQPSPSLCETFRLWGLNTLGQFLDLTRDDVGHRLGDEAAMLWDQVSGRRRRLLRLVKTPPIYRHRCDFEFEIQALEPLLFVLRRGLELLTTRLANHYLVASHVHLELRLANTTHVPEKQIFRIPDPSSDAAILFRIVQTRLEQLATTSPIVGLTLELLPSKAKKQQFDLFHTSLRDPNRFGHTLAQLESFLGSDRAGQPHALPTHRPDSFVVRPFEESLQALQKTAKQSPQKEASPTLSQQLLLGLPLRRFRPPLVIQVTTERLAGQVCPASVHDGPSPGAIQRRLGPWKLSGDWWDRKAWAREEWDVQLGQDRLYRLVHAEKTWYVEGVYG